MDGMRRGSRSNPCLPGARKALSMSVRPKPGTRQEGRPRRILSEIRAPSSPGRIRKLAMRACPGAAGTSSRWANHSPSLCSGSHGRVSVGAGGMTGETTGGHPKTCALPNPGESASTIHDRTSGPAADMRDGFPVHPCPPREPAERARRPGPRDRAPARRRRPMMRRPTAAACRRCPARTSSCRAGCRRRDAHPRRPPWTRPACGSGRRRRASHPT